jgi:hypothetical protein
MINPEIDIKAERMWNEMFHADRLNLLAENQLWDGFSAYKYYYIPEDLKNILRRRIEDKEENLPKL